MTTALPTGKRRATLTPPMTDARLVGLGTALPGDGAPTHAQLRDASRERLAELWKLDAPMRAWWNRLVDGSRIDRRYAVRPPESVMHMTTADRMRVYAEEAPPLAIDAARRALADAGVTADSVTDLIVVTCTGFGAPGVDVDLISTLGLSPNVRRAQIGFMGCFGAITGLRSAIGACSADPEAIALVVCVELCTLHLRASADRQNLVATALFGDGAAAAIVAGRDAYGSVCAGPDSAWRFGRGRRLGLGRPRLLVDERDAMSWTITDAGFAMTLERRVPTLIVDGIASFVTDAHLDPSRDRFAIHPGGAAILDAVDSGLNLAGGRGIEHAWSTLRAQGNVSSGTVLFVLQRMLAAEPTEGNGEHGSIGLLAFGPGLTMECVTLR